MVDYSEPTYAELARQTDNAFFEGVVWFKRSEERTPSTDEAVVAAIHESYASPLFDNVPLTIDLAFELLTDHKPDYMEHDTWQHIKAALSSSETSTDKSARCAPSSSG